MLERLLSVDELSELLGVSVHTIYSWVAQGRLPLVKVGKRTMFQPGEIERWVAERSSSERCSGADAPRPGGRGRSS